MEEGILYNRNVFPLQFFMVLLYTCEKGGSYTDGSALILKLICNHRLTHIKMCCLKYIELCNIV